MQRKIKILEDVQSENKRQEAKDKQSLEKACWVNHIRNLEIKNRERIDSFYRNENGKMSATTFSPHKGGSIPDRSSGNCD